VTRPVRPGAVPRKPAPAAAGGLAASGEGRSRAVRGWDVAAFVVIACAGSLLQLHFTQGLNLYYDEWAWALRYRHLGSGVLSLWGGWFDPLARLVFNALFATAGLTDFRPFQGLALGANLTLATAVFAYGRRAGLRWPALGAAALLLVLGTAYPVIIRALNAMNAVGMAALPVSLLLLELGRRRSDLLALGVLCVAMGFAGPVVLPVCLGVAVWVLLDRPLRPARLAVPGVPVAVYLAAMALLPGEARVEVDLLANALVAPRYIADLAGAGAAGLLGLRVDKGAAVLMALAVAGARLVPRLPDRARRRALAILASMVGSWAFVALARAQFGDTTAPRYVVLTVVPVLLVGIEIVGHGASATRGTLVAAFLAFAMVGNLLFLRFTTDFLREQGEVVRAQLAALELGIERAPPDYKPDPRVSWPLWYVTAGEWRSSIRFLGSPAVAAADLPQASAEGRAQADRILTELRGVDVRGASPAPGPGGPACVDHPGGTVEAPLGEAGVMVVPTGSEGLEVRVRRFGDGYPEPPLAVVPPGEARTLVPSTDASPAEWQVELRGGPAAMCGIPRAG
jgi:hypothetical protein